MGGPSSGEGSAGAQAPILAAGGIVWKDSPAGALVAVVHRPKYDDWTLPRGKRDGDEPLEQTAVREVREETGCEVRLGVYAGSTHYLSGGRPKTVEFWHMDVTAEHPHGPTAEISEVAWLPVPEAVARLSYAAERELLARCAKDRAQAL